jgi:hypothetical protein
MSQWYCLVNKEKYGPVSEEELRQWVTDGRLGGDDFVVQPGMTEWVKVAAVPQLAGLVSTGDSGMASAPVASPGYVTPQRANLEPHRGGTILTLGIIGLPLICCLIAPVFGIISWVMGAGDMKKMDAGLMDPTGRGMTQAGLVMGIIATVLGGLILILQLIGVAAEGTGY